MKKITSIFMVLCTMAICKGASAQTIPKFDHVIFVLEENYSYSLVLGTTYAPTLLALSKTPYTASFSQAFAITHPSEPNYLELFSGSNQGVTSDLSGPAPTAPFNDCNLATSLIQKGYTFIGYSEDQPSVGWIAGDVGLYYTKHCPWINWIGYNGNPDTVPEASDLPFFPVGVGAGKYFPDSLHYSNLPTVSWVIPNSVDDMHDGYVPSTSIGNGDSWFKTNIMPLVRWAVTHNSLVITIWDEDDLAHGNNIPCLFSGANIVGGTYATPKFNHYDVLRTIEDMYGITTYCGSSSTGTDITNVWVGIPTVPGIQNEVTVWPVPAKGQVNLKVTSNVEGKVLLSLHDITGRVVKENSVNMKPGDNEFTFNTEGLSGGVYFVNVSGSGMSLCKKVILQ